MTPNQIPIEKQAATDLIISGTVEDCKKICTTIEMPVKGREEDYREATLFIMNSTSPTQLWPVRG